MNHFSRYLFQGNPFTPPKTGPSGFFDSIESIWNHVWKAIIDFITGKSCRYLLQIHISDITQAYVMVFGNCIFSHLTCTNSHSFLLASFLSLFMNRTKCSGFFDFKCHIQYICMSWILMFGLLLAIFPTGKHTFPELVYSIEHDFGDAKKT